MLFKIFPYKYLLAYTYIIGHYNPSVRIIDLVSHTCLHMLFIIKPFCPLLVQEEFSWVMIKCRKLASL